MQARNSADKRTKALPRIKVISSKPRIPARLDGGGSLMGMKFGDGIFLALHSSK